MNLPQTSSALAALRARGETPAPARPVAGARVSRVEQLKAQPRNPGEASFFYADHHFQYDAVKVLPGENFVSNEELVIMTVQGS